MTLNEDCVDLESVSDSRGGGHSHTPGKDAHCPGPARSALVPMASPVPDAQSEVRQPRLLPGPQRQARAGATGVELLHELRRLR